VGTWLCAFQGAPPTASDGSIKFTACEGRKRFVHERTHFLQAFGYALGYVCLLEDVAYEQQGPLHLSQVAHGLPTHGFVGVKQCPLPAVEAGGLGQFSAQALPGTLQVRQMVFSYPVGSVSNPMCLTMNRLLQPGLQIRQPLP